MDWLHAGRFGPNQQAGPLGSGVAGFVVRFVVFESPKLPSADVGSLSLSIVTEPVDHHFACSSLFDAPDEGPLCVQCFHLFGGHPKQWQW